MTEAKLGLITFPGINFIQSGSFTLSHGISPSAAIIKLTPQNNFTCKNGTMSIVYGNESIDFPKCALDLASLDIGDNGQTWSMKIVDRRWMWGLDYITGAYNTLRPNKTIDLERERSPQQLAKLLLDAMGEANYNVAQLPNQTRPLVVWDYDTPAEMLARLCDSLDCRVVLRTDNTVWICRNGKGDDLPTDRIMGGGYGFDPPEMPDSIKFVFGPTKWQMKLDLEAVGIDVDGTVKLIEDLSYNPAGEGEVYGWANQDPKTFQGLIKIPSEASVTRFNELLVRQGEDPRMVSLASTGEEIRQLALSCVYRMYRIRIPSTKEMKIPNYGDIKDIKQLLPIDDHLLTDATPRDQLGHEVIDGFPLRQTAIVSGVFYNNIGDPLFNINTPDGTKYPGSFSIDKERGIVIFSDPVYASVFVTLASGSKGLVKKDQVTTIVGVGDEAYLPASIRLECTFGIKEDKTRVHVRHTIDKGLTNDKYGTGPKIVKRDDVVLTQRVVHKSIARPRNVDGLSPTTHIEWVAALRRPLEVSKVIENKTEVETKAKYYVANEADSLMPKENNSISYPYITRIELDGAIQQVTWNVGESGATTEASRNNESNLTVPSYVDRRIAEIARRERFHISNQIGEVL